jgi:DNA-binding NarL/FixJ family response regulator
MREIMSTTSSEAEASSIGQSTGTDPIRILIAEDQQLIRRAFATILSLEPDMDVVAQAADGAEAVRLARMWRPDIVLMDLQMPRLGGVAATQRIVSECPGTQVIVLTSFDTDDLVFEAISSGAQAYLLKDASEADIFETIRSVKRGESRLAPNIARKVLDEFRRVRPADAPLSKDEAPSEPLTEREERVLALVAEGRSNKEIANAACLAEGTVKNYVSRIMEKLHARTRTELAVKALRKPKRKKSSI